MNNPSLLFVYRMAKDGDEVAARCICCDVNSPESWNRQMEWSGVSLNTGKQVEFRLSVSDYSGGPEGPAEVYGEENCMKAVSKEDWIPVRVSQNGTYIRINDVSNQEDCPSKAQGMEGGCAIELYFRSLLWYTWGKEKDND
ncbi:MAG TPA: hypothetical protein PKD54_06730 [Pirellulaceae bacterium]|nr:hypothetical protein [Pirellulaceae bacterium]